MKDFYTLADLQHWDAAQAGNESPIQLGVIGDPVAHSRSPQMMNAALQHCGLKMQYARFQIALDESEAALRLMASAGFVGVNLTVPHKISAIPLMHELDDSARQSGAVNCVRFERERLVGGNTDGPGFARAIRSEFSAELRDLRVLLLGAGGGAGRAIARQCAREGCRRLVLANRTLEKAERLADELQPFFGEEQLEAVPWNEARLRSQIAHTDLIVNATSIGMRRSDAAVLPAKMLGSHLLVYDTVYAPGRTSLLDAVAEVGARGANGLSMLLHQGALAFEKWFERDAPLEVMRPALQF